MEREFLDITIEDVTPVMGVEVSMASPHLSVGVDDITPRLMVECEQVYEVEEGGALYTPLEYIESTGTQWIDTFVGGDNNNLRIDFECYITGFTAYAGLFGNYINETTNCWRAIMTASSTSQLYANANMRGGFATTITAPIKTDLSICVEYDKITVNGKSYSTRKNAGSLNDNSICLFRQNSSSGGSKMRLYSFKIYDNNKIIRDFIPVIDDKNIPCLYDLVNEEFYYNKGTGEFIPSPLPSKHTELEYIESTGTQWIDTGYAFNDDFSWEIDFEGITPNKTVFGGRTSTNRTALLYQYNVNNITTCPIGSSNGQKTPFQLGNLSKGRHVVKMSVSASKGSVWVDGVQKYNNTSFAGAYITGTTQAIFADNFGGGDIQEFTNSKVYGLKMWQGTTLVRDFIPVLDKESTPCMYDKVSGEYFYNQGTNNFLYELK